MNILILGNPDSIYIKDFIEYYLLESKKQGRISRIAIFTIHKYNKIFDKFYASKDIKIFSLYKSSMRIFFSVPKIGIFFKIVIFKLMLGKLSAFDICHIQGIDWFYGFVMGSIRNSSYRVVSGFWGSDLYKVKGDVKIKLQRRILNNSDLVILGTDMMRRVYLKKYRNVRNKNVKVIYFPSPIINYYVNRYKSDKDKCKNLKLNLPANNKIVVTVGYNGSTNQQHLSIIERVNKIDSTILKNVLFVFPVTYGGSVSYLNAIKKKLEDASFEFLVLENFLSYDDIIYLFERTDVYVHLPVTDSFSSAMRENIYFESVVITGSWLNYEILDKNNVFYLKIKSIKDLSCSLANVLDKIEYFKNRSVNNKMLIDEFVLWNKVKNKWDEVYFVD